MCVTSPAEVYAEGDKERLKELLQHLKTGPHGAKVDKVEVNWSEQQRGFPRFEVRY